MVRGGGGGSVESRGNSPCRALAGGVQGVGCGVPRHTGPGADSQHTSGQDEPDGHPERSGKYSVKDDQRILHCDSGSPMR